MNEIAPAATAAINRSTWVPATHPQASVRNGNEAVAFARRSVELSGASDPAALDTLAAAYAESARWTEALQTARQARHLAAAQSNAPLSAKIDARIKLYQAGTPCRDPPK